MRVLEWKISFEEMRFDCMPLSIWFIFRDSRTTHCAAIIVIIDIKILLLLEMFSFMSSFVVDNYFLWTFVKRLFVSLCFFVRFVGNSIESLSNLSSLWKLFWDQLFITNFTIIFIISKPACFSNIIFVKLALCC